MSKKQVFKNFMYLAFPNIIIILLLVCLSVFLISSITTSNVPETNEPISPSNIDIGGGVLFILLYIPIIIFVVGPCLAGLIYIMPYLSIIGIVNSLSSLIVVNFMPFMPKYTKLTVLLGALCCAAFGWICHASKKYGKFLEDESYVSGSHIEISFKDGVGKVEEVDDYSGSTHFIKNCWLLVGRFFLICFGGIIVFIVRIKKRKNINSQDM